MRIQTGLLKLIRPLKWQHVYIPYLLTSCADIFHTIVKRQQPFVIGAYMDILCSGEHSSILSHDYDINLSNVTIVDIDRCVIKPGKRVAFAAACMMHEKIAPELDPILLSDILHATSPSNESLFILQKPAIPVRYRINLYRKMYSVLHSVPLTTPQLIARNTDMINSNLILTNIEISNKTTSTRDYQVIADMNSILVKDVFDVMVSLFKGLVCFNTASHTNIRDITTPDDYVTKMTQKDLIVYKMLHPSDSNMNSNEYIDERNLLLFMKDDMRPFIQYLFHTKSFKVQYYIDYKVVIYYRNRNI
jgi:hypothetical protein